MGKKKMPKKTKELSVAIAESSSIGTEQPQQQTPRKRGRPRKVVEKIESGEIINKEEQREEAEVAAETESKKAKTSQKEEEEEEEEPKMQGAVAGGSSSVGGKEREKEEQQQPPLPRSRARRKSKPRKSS